MSEAIGERGRIVGALVGLAAGDALGVPVEFEPRAARVADPVGEMRGGGTWKLDPGLGPTIPPSPSVSPRA